jgi:catechol 2,3-dioxygenase-like lactoylglutathione lyase family enzyme
LATGPGFVLGWAIGNRDFKTKGVNHMSVSVGVLDHFNIRTRNLNATVRFYEDVLGLEKGARPNFAFPGAWMYSEGKPVVHLVDISKTDEPQKPDSGVVHHVAFISRGFSGMRQRLEAGKFEYDARQVPGGDLWQIFVNDPNGVMIELNYEAAKEGGILAPTERADDVGVR